MSNATSADDAGAVVAALVSRYAWIAEYGIELTAAPAGDGIVLTARCGSAEGRGLVRRRDGGGPLDAERVAPRVGPWLRRWFRAAFLTPDDWRSTLGDVPKPEQKPQQDPARVFLSWSGEPSRTVATALRDWLLSVIQAIKPWMSQEDIHAGAQWGAEVAKELGACHVGVSCVTPDNHRSPWLLFEAGALAKNMGVARVCPYLLCGMRPSDLSGPLSQFQAKAADRGGTLDVLKMINAGLGADALPAERLNENFELWWPKLEQQLANLPTPQARAHRPVPEMRNLRG